MMSLLPCSRRLGEQTLGLSLWMDCCFESEGLVVGSDVWLYLIVDFGLS